MKLAPVRNRPGARAAIVAGSPLERIAGELAELDLRRVGDSTIEALLRAIPVTAADLTSVLLAAPPRYTRNLVHRQAAFEIVALHWSAGARSPIHDHGGSRCFVSVVSGSLVSDEFALISGGRVAGPAKLSHLRTRTLAAGDIDVRTSQVDIHRVAAPAAEAISLHIYAEPLDRYLVFDREAEVCRDARSRYDERPR
jgi:cysteine dioxygenase